MVCPVRVLPSVSRLTVLGVAAIGLALLSTSCGSGNVVPTDPIPRQAQRSPAEVPTKFVPATVQSVGSVVRTASTKTPPQITVPTMVPMVAQVPTRTPVALASPVPTPTAVPTLARPTPYPPLWLPPPTPNPSTSDWVERPTGSGHSTLSPDRGRRGASPQPRCEADEGRTGLLRELRIRWMGRNRGGQAGADHA